MKTEKLLFGMSLLFTLIAMAGCEKESEELPTCQNDQLGSPAKLCVYA